MKISSGKILNIPLIDNYELLKNNLYNYFYNYIGLATKPFLKIF